MKWEEIKQSIIEDLMSRGLADPNIRIRALNNVEVIMREHFPEWIANPTELKNIDKEIFKREIFYKKGKDLNGAEKSVLNEIYCRVAPSHANSAISRTPSVPSVKYRICVCPYCFTSHKLTEDLWGYDNLTCGKCGNDIPNPVKEEDVAKQVSRGFLMADMLGDVAKMILLIGVMIFSIILMTQC